MDLVNIVLLLGCLLLGLALLASQRHAGKRARELSRLKNEVSELSSMLKTDDLTSAFSRRYVREVFRQEPQDGRNVLGFVDLDNFKSVNDGYGHKSGDALLREISNRLMRIAKPSEVVFRLGGDEFGIYMRNVSITEATERAAEFGQAISDVSIDINGVKVSRSASVGVARIEKGQDLVGALYYADEAQWAAKLTGGNAVLSNTGDTLRSMIQRRTGPRAEDIAAALSRDEVTYHVQPIFNTRTGAAIGVEALMRWQRQDGRLVLPEQFLGVMNSTAAGKLTSPIAEARRIASRFTNADQDLFCAFNISSHSIDRSVDDQSLLQDSLEGLDANKVVFEIVEHSAITDLSKARDLLIEFRQKGVRIALDDFGTGFSNFERLQQIPVDIVKIDRRFVQNIDKHGADLGILRALLDLSREMKFDVIAEGVETQAELERIQEIGIFNVQGFLLGKPDTAENWVRRLGLAPRAVSEPAE